MSKGKCADIFKVFFKIGAFTFGGGYAMLPLIKREVVEEKNWLDESEIFDVIAISESTPGPIAINCATFVGNRVAGTKGALAATFGVVLPSFLVIVLISQILLQIEHLEIVKNAFAGIRVGVLVLIGSAVISLFKQLNKNVFTYTLLAVAVSLTWLLRINTIMLLIICAICGILWSYCLRKRDKQ